MLDILIDAVLDTVKLVPFLFLTYVVMEYLEHKTGQRAQNIIKKAGSFGPVLGGLLGIAPQCGFSAAASNLYAGRVITLGTLFAIYLSTSDEMLPILLSEQAPIKTILLVLLTKAVIGIVAGFVIDLVFRKEVNEHGHIHELCEKEHCHCENGILLSAISHTLQISFFILLICIILNGIFFFVGEEVLGQLILNRPVVGPLLASLVGLIPNCAGSVVITQLYLEGVISIATAISGLLTGTGVGVLILFRVNHSRRENLKILGLLYGIGVFVGIIAEIIL